MSREIKRRAGLPRMRFHVMNRGARKVDIYSSDEDRSLFVTLLARFTVKHQIRLIAWCLMSNHYHLEAEGEGTALLQMMHDLDGTYARHYNRRYEGSGCLFQGRFKCMSITDDDGAAYVSRYIHANPAAVGIDPKRYGWSSCASYLGIADIPPWLDPRPVLDLMGPTPAEQTRAYRAYLEAAPPPRPGQGRDVDDRREFYLEYVRHLGMRCWEAMDEVGGAILQVSPRAVFSWIARRKYGIPASILVGMDESTGPNALSRRIWRLDNQLRQDLALQAGLERVVGQMQDFACPQNRAATLWT